jgi:hypothetical protein
MRARTLGVVTAAPFMLLATACGSQTPATFHPAGASIPAATPTTSTTSGNLDPFPGKVSFTFDSLPADPTQAAVVTADRDFLLSYYDAIYTRGKNTGYTSYINNSGVLRSVSDAVAEHVSAQQGFVGVDRHFDTTVTPTPYYPGEENVNYCVDEAGLQYTNIVTGKVLGNSSTPGELYYLESDTFAKNGHGSWQLVGILTTPYPTGQARECKP